MVDTANAQAPQKSSGRRVPYWDNIRFACIVLVVAGHGIQRLTYDSDWALTVYLAIYAFHMPAFAVVSGYFSKSEPPGRRQMSRVITDIILPYIIFESVWTLVQFAVEGQGNLNPTQPSWTLWFLLALGIFRLVLPYLALIRWPVLWAVVVSVGVGYLDNVDSTFSLSRTLGILPFFVIGWRLRTTPLADIWHAADRKVVMGVRAAAVAFFALAVWVFWSGIDLWRAIDLRYWFFYDDSYEGLGEDQWWAGGVRLGLIVIALLLVTALFSLVPRRQMFFTTFGQYTMYAYLLHSFVLYPLRETGVLRDETTTRIWLVAMLIGSVFLTMALSSSPVRRVFRPLIEPKPRWLFSDNPDRKRGESRTDPTGSRRDTPRRRPDGETPGSDARDADARPAR
ncbi:acyltransferase family protein [Labedella endophytica]|uniref:Fucose 4-O-acetylase n=1 Tax=Labedella endophytica TaxID=1523160 RepID=A0A3S0X7F5_9MICO|nr:acyltransferase family protein [Labedella endophytica]RUR01093.1 fucose 4-O-acetylase [Labedella endophytica]